MPNGRFHSKTGKYLKDAVYGANDGIVTTFAVVAGVAGAALSPVTIIILGVANLFADGFSMAASNFLASRSERDFYTKQNASRAWEAANPEPLKSAAITLIAFVGAGFLPILPYVGIPANGASFRWSIALAGISFFVVGALRTLFTAKSWLWSGMEMLVVGGLASGIAYITGYVVRMLVG
ncbi:MAG: VIT1/CCC1 transporter family protein [Candidatus Niyogibacteria bacterium]|nr:VIT1/CCC1 transporter family protein [Candidatus Niyogibacteria bacterium]